MKNEMLKFLLVDDEPDALDLLENLLMNRAGIEEISKAGNRGEAVRKMIDMQPDVIFQDIQMMGTNGLDLIDEYRKYHFSGEIVFVTAHAEYAIEAIKKTAFDYLLKPVDPDDLEALIFRLLSKRNNGNVDEYERTEKLKISTRTGYSLVNKSEIVFCEAEGNYTKIIKADMEEITASMNLGKLATTLTQANFFRISRSTMINLDFLTAVNKGKKECQLKVTGKKYSLHISIKKIKELENLIK